VSDGDGEGLEFEASSYDDGSAEMGLAAAHLDRATEESAAIQGQAGAQLRQWLPTVPAADTLDEVEGTADRALSQAAGLTRDDAGKLLTAKQNMLDTEARNTALAEQIGRGDTAVPGTGGGPDAPSQIGQALSGEPAAAPPDDSAAYAARVDQQIQDRIDELRTDGPGAHGPQRHLDVTDTQLQQRLGTPVRNPDGTPQLKANGFVKATDQIDPMTGTTTDAVTGMQHGCGSLSTRFDSPADYAHAESVLRARADATGIGHQETPIEDLLGPDGHTKLTGYYIDPAKPESYLPVNFGSGSVTAIFKYDIFGKPHLYTMYPEPAPGVNP
jgi:hypothetical protein